MNATTHVRPRALVLLWVSVLAGPIAWSMSLCFMFWMSRQACIESTLRWVLTAGVVCTVITVAAGVRAGVGFTQPLGRIPLTRFMLGLAVGASALFALVIVLSMVPITMLTPCPP